MWQCDDRCDSVELLWPGDHVTIAPLMTGTQYKPLNITITLLLYWDFQIASFTNDLDIDGTETLKFKYM